MVRLRSLGFVLAVLVAGPAPAFAQEFGRWSWDASLGASKRTYENLIGDEGVSDDGQRDLTLSLAINGFVLHPAVARFRLGLDTQLSSYSGGRSFGTHRWGARGDLSLFPAGKYRLSLFGVRRLYDYTGLTEEDPLTLLGTPEASTGFGGRLRLSTGRLRGTLLGFERTRLSFLGSQARPEVQEREFVDWSRAGRRFQRHLRVDRRAQDFGTVDYSLEDLDANYTQQGHLAPSWRWNMFAVASRRSLRFEARPGSRFDNFRTSQAFLHTRRQHDLVDLSYTGGLTRTGSGGSFQSHAVSARYRWRPKTQWELAPFAGYGMQLSNDVTVRSPQLGVSTTWFRRGEALDVSLSDSVSYALVQRSGRRDSGTDSLLVLSLGGSVAHGEETTLRKEFEASWSRNELRAAGERLEQLPDLGAGLAGAGTEDQLRARLTLRRRWRAFVAGGYGEWSRREPSGAALGASPGVDTSTASLQVTGPGFNILGNLSGAQVRAATSQDVSSRSVAASWRPWRPISLTASYRADVRRSVLVPSVEGERLEGGVDVRLGAFSLQAHGFSTRERRPSLAERTNRGLTLTIARRFAGWLPIITSPLR